MRDTRVDLTIASGAARTPFLTYEPYYGLNEKPFSLSSNPRFLYKSRTHAAVYDDIRAGIRRREGVVVLTGDIGTGKTTLCRAVLGDLDRKTFSTFVPDPFVSREDLLKMLLIDFGVLSIEDLKSGRLEGAARPELSYPLYDFLKTLVPLQAFAVLVIDEAQNLALPLLEEIRILSDLEGPEKLLQVVLIGQLEFLPKLKDPAMRQLDQRVSVRCTLHELDRESVAEYIEHRLGVAGGAPDRVTFEADAVDAIYRGTHGNPRLINLVCDRALFRGHQARTFTIGPDLVRRALDELGITELTPASRRAVDFGLDKLSELGPFVSESQPEAQTLQLQVPAPTAAEPEPEPLELDAVMPPPRRVFDDARIVALPDRSGTKRWMAVGLLGLVLGAALLSGWQVQRTLTGEIVLPQLPAAPGREIARGPTLPPAPIFIESAASRLNGAGQFEIGVGVFGGRARAGKLEADLAATGFRASTQAITFRNARMFEVRTGPYPTREAAEADAARIRRLPGYGDARVIAPPASTPPQ